MEVEDVSRVCLAARRATKKERHLAVCHGLLGEVVVDDECVLALLHEVLADSSTCERCEVLEGSRRGCRCSDDDGVLHCALVCELCNELRGLRLLLADSNVHTDRTILSRLRLLVDDGVYRDGGLTRSAVTNDELALAATNWHHGVDSLNARVKRRVHRRAVHNAVCFGLDRTNLVGTRRALAVYRLAERIHHATDERVTYWDGE